MRVKQFLYFLSLLLASVNIECQAFVKYVTISKSQPKIWTEYGIFCHNCDTFWYTCDN